MLYHHHGYVTTDPRLKAAAGTGIDRPDQLPDTMDVLIVGSGPAGVIAAAQLAQFPEINTRLIERRPHRLAMGTADGIQARSVETFQAFGFAERITAESYRITETAFWKPNPENPAEIIRTARTPDDEHEMSEFPHLVCNQARMIDYFLEAAAMAPTRLKPDYGIEFVGLEIAETGEHPVAVTLRHTAGPNEGEEFVVHAKYVIGADGARSGVRKAIGAKLVGNSADHAWGVMDVLGVTDFPDVRTKSAIQSADGGSVLLIAREGGHLARWYVDLGEVAKDDNGAVRKTPLETIIARANEIIAPYTLEVKDVPWWSVYEVGHRIADRFDDVPLDQIGKRQPRVFITGDACHTHSAKAAQGMNVSMQDGWNIAWKLGQVLTGRAPESLLETYQAERKVTAQNLIDYDKEWSTLMATKPEDLPDPTYLERYYVDRLTFSHGFSTEYTDSMITGNTDHQALATGFPVGKRFHSFWVERVCDGNPVQLGHLHEADGRYRIYAFADRPAANEHSKLTEFAHWLDTAPDSPINLYTPAGADRDSVIQPKVIYQQDHLSMNNTVDAPAVFKPRQGPFGMIDYEEVFGADPARDIFDERGISRDGAIVIVRPDQYVGAVLPLTAHDELAAYFAGALQPAN